MSDSERRERIFKRKALLTWRAALSLLDSNPNSAANRIYYALFQALVGEFERLGVQPEKIDAGSAHASERDIALKWTHSFVKRNARLAGLDSRQCQLIRDAYTLRIMADYRVDDVVAEDLNSMLKQIQAILKDLGVEAGA